MDKPTSEKDVIKILPPLTVEQKYNKALQRPVSINSIIQIKFVFERMLAALKVVDDAECYGDDVTISDKVRAAIKEAEELGL